MLKILGKRKDEDFFMLREVTNPMTTSDPSSLLYHPKDERSTIEKLWQKSFALLQEFGPMAYTAYHRCLEWKTLNPAYADLSEELPEWKEESSHLYVLIHGLGGHPSAWNGYMKDIEENNPQADLLVPHVSKRGNCSLEEAAEPILKAIQDYAKTFPKNPVILIGTSNGGRIAAHLSSLLQKEVERLKVCSIAGVFFGTEVIDLLNKFSWISQLFYCKDILEDLSFGSEQAQKMLEDLKETTHSFHFWATHDDTRVLPVSSCLPKIEQAEYQVLTSVDHTRIVDHVREEVLQVCQNWLNKK